MTKKIDSKLLEKAKRMYMEYVPVTKIAEELKINRTSIHHYVDSYWKEEREINRLELLDYMTSGKKKDLMSMTGSSIKIIARALEDLSKRDEPPSIREAAKVSEILSALDKITRLDENRPTEITSDQPFTVVEIREKLLLDPFSQPKEVEFEEIKENDESDS